MHLSREDSNARLRVMKGLKVMDFLLHFTQVTIVFYIPTKCKTFANYHWKACLWLMDESTQKCSMKFQHSCYQIRLFIYLQLVFLRPKDLTLYRWKTRDSHANIQGKTYWRSPLLCNLDSPQQPPSFSDHHWLLGKAIDCFSLATRPDKTLWMIEKAERCFWLEAFP